MPERGLVSMIVLEEADLIYKLGIENGKLKRQRLLCYCRSTCFDRGADVDCNRRYVVTPSLLSVLLRTRRSD